MRSLLLLAVLALGIVLVVGSSGNFMQYRASRTVSFSVVPHEEEYLGFNCANNSSAVVELWNGEEAYFDALSLTNNLGNGKEVSITLDPDYSALPVGALMEVETDDGSWVSIDPSAEHTFSGHVRVSSVEPGEYLVPMTIYADWDGGDAAIHACPIRLIVHSAPRISKVLLSGNTTGIPLKTYQEWVFQIKVDNPTGEDLDLTVRDTIPAEFNVSISRVSTSSGNYSFFPASGGNHGHSHPATKMEWNVTVPAGGSEYINVTIYTRVNHGNQQEFTSCGDYSLNDGAFIVGYGIRSNGITVSTACSCCSCGGSSVKSVNKNETGECEG